MKLQLGIHWGNLRITKIHVKLNYTFALDQNYNDFNYNEIGTSLDFNPIKFDFNYNFTKREISFDNVKINDLPNIEVDEFINEYNSSKIKI